MMTKLEYLAMSLPYGLKIKDSFSTPKLTGIMDHEYHFGDSLSIDGAEHVKPICRPLSDLTKKIEHKGEKFVPIIELAKVAFTNSRFSFKLSEGLDKFVWIDDYWNNFKFYFEGYIFWYSKERKCFYSMFEKSDIPVHNQLQLFQKLIELHFDLFGGIESGEAIDVNTLDINPYK